MVKSNQRITKIKRDPIEELLKRAEATTVEQGTIINEPGADLTPYPTSNELYTWMRDYLLKGINCIYNNYIDVSGETYYTTIVDGLVLMTKNTKAIGQLPLIKQDFIQPQLTSPGTIGGQEFAVSGSGNKYPNDYGNYETATHPDWGAVALPYINKSDPSTTYMIFYNPEPITLTGFKYNFAHINDYAFQGTYYNIEGSNDGQVWQKIGTYEIDERYNTSGYDTSDRQVVTQVDISGVTQAYKYFKVYQSEYGSLAKTYYFICYFCLLGTVMAPGDVNSSKPGLWLSNLASPYTYSSAGGWLRQNLIADYDNEFNQLNSDIIGNYTYSFLNQGIIYRQSGSTHDGQDSYIQHWSPSLMGSMSYEGMIIPKGLNQTFLFQSSYTNYQTLAVPANPDMRVYTESNSKEVTYNFVDNNNNNPPAITTFNGRFVGTDWSYELEFKQNNSGSCMDYDPETGDCPSHENQSNGGCVTGKIIYSTPAGSPCEVQIDECFNTYQSIANPQVPAVPNLGTKVKPLDTSQESNFKTSHYTASTCNCHAPIIYNVEEQPIPFPGYRYVVQVSPNGGSIFLLDYDTNEYVNSTKHTNTKLGYNYDEARDRYSISGFQIEAECCEGWCDQPCTWGDITFCKVNDLPGEEKGINIYFNIKDIKVEYTLNGLPWDFDCTVTRFETWFSTEPSSDIGVSSILIASNVDINSLGDISMLTDKTL